MRNYRVMREVLLVTAEAPGTLGAHDYYEVRDQRSVDRELQRLLDDGLVRGEVEFGRGGECKVFEIEGLTSEGEAFYKLVENDDAWAIILKTLEGAGVDVSYPLLKEVCEEIVKRYVISFIPQI